MKSNKLTPKQDKFARLVAEGKTQAEAYRLSYNSAKMKPETVQNSAYKLMQNGEIKARVDELKEENKKKHEYTVEKLVKELDEIEELAKQPIHGKDQNNYDLTNWIKIKSEKAKLFGLYAPTKTDNKTTLEIQNPQEALNKLNNSLENL